MSSNNTSPQVDTSTTPFDSSTTTNPSADREDTLDWCESKKVHIGNNQDKWLLIVLCIGLKNDDGSPLLNVSCEAWAAQPIDVRKPLQTENYQAEVKRRGELFDVQPRPKPAQWNVEKMMAWLMDRPIDDPSCIFFFSEEAAHVTAIFKDKWLKFVLKTMQRRNYWAAL